MGEAVLLESNLYHRHLSRHRLPTSRSWHPITHFLTRRERSPGQEARQGDCIEECLPTTALANSFARTHTHTQHSTKVRKRKPSNARPGTLLPEITWALAVESTAEMRTAVTNHRRRPPKYQPLSCMSDTPSKCTQLAKRPFLFFHLKLNPSSFLRGVEQSNKGASQTRPL